MDENTRPKVLCKEDYTGSKADVGEVNSNKEGSIYAKEL